MMVTAGDVGVLAKLGCGTQYRMPFNNENNLQESYIEGVRLKGKKNPPEHRTERFVKHYRFGRGVLLSLGVTVQKDGPVMTYV